jgi:hypothetical protein
MRLRRRKTLVLAAALSLLILAQTQVSGQESSPDARTETFHGQVLNSVTQQPIPRALVSSGDNRFAVLTDDEGRFEFTRPTSGSGESDPTMARKPGFLNTSSMTTNGATRQATVWLTPEALIIGRAIFPAEEFSDRVGVEIYHRVVADGRSRWYPIKSARSNSSGEFRFADLPAGSYKVFTHELLDRDPLTFDPRGQLYGYPPVYFPNGRDLEAASTIELSAGEIFQADISLVRRPYYRVKIFVGNPPPGGGLGVNIDVQGHRGAGYQLGYDADDQAIEGLLPDGDYTLQASSFGERGTGSTGMLNFVIRGGPTEGRMILAPNATIAVNVKEEFTAEIEAKPQGSSSRDWHAAPGIHLDFHQANLEPADDSGAPEAATLRPPKNPQDESLAFENVAPGRYWLRIYPNRGFAASATSGQIDLLQQPLVVGLGGAVSPIEVTMRDDWAQLEGNVVKSTGTAGSPNDNIVGFVYCVPVPDSHAGYREAYVSPDGHFSTEQLQPGSYLVLAFDRAQPDLEYRNPEVMRAYESRGVIVRLAPGQKEKVQVPLIAGSNE